MRGGSSEEALWDKDTYERLAATHGARVCAYRTVNGRFADPQFNEEVQTFGQQIIYCGVGYLHQNEIVDLRIKELVLGIHTLLLHVTILWPESVNNIMCPFSLNASFQRYTSL